MSCYNSGDFGKYFKENMDGLGMPVPSGLFETYDKAVTTASAMVGALKTLGSGATVAELIGATTGAEAIMVAGALGASAYVGAVDGSIAVASGRSLNCGTRMIDLFSFMSRYPGLKFEGWHEYFIKNPEILDKEFGFRHQFAAKALVIHKRSAA